MMDLILMKQVVQKYSKNGVIVENKGIIYGNLKEMILMLQIVQTQSKYIKLLTNEIQ